jgi:hypothetical protein
MIISDPLRLIFVMMRDLTKRLSSAKMPLVIE